MNLNKQNSFHKKEARLPSINITTDSPGQAHPKTDTRFFGIDTPNPRLSDDNQSGASVDSATRKRKMLAFNPIE